MTLAQLAPVGLLGLLSLLAPGCTGSKADDSGGPDTNTSDAVCEEPTEVQCVEEMILDLSLQDDKVEDGSIETTVDGTDFVTTVDASAGGYGNETKHAWVYLKFGDSGAESVAIDDETALESMDWDLSLRRFILRLNGGSSGPSCVGAAVMGDGYTYENLTSIPDGVTYQVDDYYTDAPDCTIVNDSSGLEGSPQVVLAPWWEYSTCVATTDQPFLIQLADGRVIKFRVEAYYGDGQDDCNTTGTPTADGGFFTLRWAFLN